MLPEKANEDDERDGRRSRLVQPSRYLWESAQNLLQRTESNICNHDSFAATNWKQQLHASRFLCQCSYNSTACVVNSKKKLSQSVNTLHILQLLDTLNYYKFQYAFDLLEPSRGCVVGTSHQIAKHLKAVVRPCQNFKRHLSYPVGLLLASCLGLIRVSY